MRVKEFCGPRRPTERSEEGENAGAEVFVALAATAASAKVTLSVDPPGGTKRGARPVCSSLGVGWWEDAGRWIGLDGWCQVPGGGGNPG